MIEILERIASARVLVVGDLMLDRYWWGSVSRISPEAPVPVVKIERMSLAAGGAGNVAVNIASLGAAPTFVASVGADAEAEQVRQTLRAAGVVDSGLIVAANRPTIVKTRLVAHNQHVARIDQEDDASHDPEGDAVVLAAVETLLPDNDVLVLSDYAKGLLSPELTAALIQAANDAGKPVLVDPKGKDYSRYRGATLLTPNKREAAEACNLDEHHPDVVAVAGARLVEDLQVGSLLITQGSEGMTIFDRDGAKTHLPALARQVFDVTGAGDTVIATLAVAIAADAGTIDAARLANIAAGLVVEQAGTTPITFDELARHLTDTP